ncbi:Peptidase, family S49 [Litoreibacter arenae DSM 19593]|uniref:Peptidase, family S49 n=2 Tax=Litoreibacter TaxID=947567 RepID=S9QQA1_9RHOB|nr:Peptidase, family S49 [Litoreibacter arenae DSM 19593]
MATPARLFPTSPLFGRDQNSTWQGMKRFIPFLKSPPTVNVVALSGAIASGGRIGTLNDAGLASTLTKAFKKGKPAAVALQLNSPGGSPAQSSLIGARIRRLAEENDVPVFAFVEDVAASGGYWLAASADEIFVDATSIVGSIGVISASFGFNELMQRQGIERRVHTAGKDKSMLDPFRPERPADVKRLKALQAQIHDTFIDHVKSRRGARLSEDGDLFTGEIWVGQKAIDVGLADAIGHLVPVMKERFGDKVRFNTFGPKRSLFQRFGVRVLTSAIDQLDEKALWARFGL